MRLTCPFCGERDLREFSYKGDAVYLARPVVDAGPDAWDAYLHLRKNPAGRTADLWYHVPCRTWLRVQRDTRSHEIFQTDALAEAADAD